MNETQYQADLMRRIPRDVLPGAAVFRQDPVRYQGHPDLLILHGRFWAMLEVKISESAPEQPNQRYWVEHFNNLSFAAFIYPENEEEVLRGLQLAFGYLG